MDGFGGDGAAGIAVRVWLSGKNERDCVMVRVWGVEVLDICLYYTYLTSNGHWETGVVRMAGAAWICIFLREMRLVGRSLQSSLSSAGGELHTMRNVFASTTVGTLGLWYGSMFSSSLSHQSYQLVFIRLAKDRWLLQKSSSCSVESRPLNTTERHVYYATMKHRRRPTQPSLAASTCI